MTTMKILIATPLYPPDIGGPATFTRFAEARLPDFGIMVIVEKFGRVRRLPLFVRHIAFCLRVLQKSHGADTVLALDPLGIGLPAFLAAKMARKRFFVRIAGDRAWEHENRESRTMNRRFISCEEFQTEKHGFSTRLRQRLQSFVCKKAGRVIVPSEFLKRIVLGWGVHPEKIFVVPNMFDAPVGGRSPEAAHRALGVTAAVTMIVSAGRLTPWKGFPMLVDVLKRVRREHADAELFIVGDGPDRPVIEKRVMDEGAGAFVHLVGACPRDALFLYLAAADVFVLNTGYEGFSHQILEAMAAGTPVVTTDIPGNHEIVENGVNGVLVPYDDAPALAGAVSRLLGHPREAGRMTEEAHTTLRRFNAEDIAHKLADVLSRE